MAIGTLSSFLAKAVAILLFAVSFFVPGSHDKMDISVSIASVEAQVIYVSWKNNTGKAITQPTYYLEKQENDGWTAVEFAEGFGFPEIYTQYYPTEGSSFRIDVQRDLKEPLSAGTYRITLCYELLYSNNTSGRATAVFCVE